MANSLNDHFSSVFEMESKAEKMPNFEPTKDKKLSVYFIMQKLSVIQLEKVFDVKRKLTEEKPLVTTTFIHWYLTRKRPSNSSLNDFQEIN